MLESVEGVGGCWGCGKVLGGVGGCWGVLKFVGGF